MGANPIWEKDEALWGAHMLVIEDAESPTT
jgi:hypothetical protein